MKDLKTMRIGRVIVLCDFDGTITPDDTTDGILATCAYPEWKEIEDQWEAHEISTQDCMEQQTLCIRARSRRKLLSYLDHVNIDPLFPSFVEFCRANKVSLIVQSDGYDLAIDRVLGRWKFNDLPIRSNKLCQHRDESFRLEFPHLSQGCADTLGTCKCSIAWQERSKSWDSQTSLIVIGNDRTDKCVATQADFVIARGPNTDAKADLWTFCKENEMSYELFDDFGQVQRIIADLTGFPVR